MRAVWLCVPVLVLSVTGALAAKITLPGEVTYREHVPLPDNATLELQLVDQTLPGTSPRVDVTAPIGSGSVPLSFNLVFDEMIVIPSHSYALIAAVSGPGGLMFRNFEPYAVDPLAPAQPVLIVTNMVGQPPPAEPSSAAPATPAAAPAILYINWTAVRIGDAALLPRTTISLTIGSDLRAGGQGGCNSWIAQAQLDGESIHFGAATTTRKSCADPVNAQEHAFTDALAATASWRIVGNELTLYGSGGNTLITFRR